MLKYIAGFAVCLSCLGVGIWGTVTYWPSGRMVTATVDNGISEHLAQPGSHLATDNAPVIVVPEPQAPPVQATENIPSPAGVGAVHASFTVVG